MSNIKKAFENGKAFIPFVTCGFPDFETSIKIIHTVAESGADMIELGLPFSDPTAEGPVIQLASLKALENGMTAAKAFEMAMQLRQDGISIPLVFMTYANVVFSYGSDKFISTCHDIGIDGLILPDIPYEERSEFLDTCRKYSLDLIPFVAPTSKNRAAMIAKEAEGFIYIVSSLGVTGVRSEITTDIAGIVKTIRENTDVPCAVGFGISNPQQAHKMAKVADGVIVGSALIKIIDAGGPRMLNNVADFVSSMKAAL